MWRSNRKASSSSSILYTIQQDPNSSSKMLSRPYILLSFGALASAAAVIGKRGDVPGLQYDPNTSPYCSYWIDNTDASLRCTQVAPNWGIPLSSFLRWNPSLGSDCSNFRVGWSYCVETYDEPVTPPQTTTAATTTPTGSATTTTRTTTTSNNGIATPSPTQPNMVGNCNKFYFVPENTGCDQVSSLNGITTSLLLQWNPSIGSTCGGLWANVYVCVGTLDYVPPKTTTTTPRPTTTTAPANPTNWPSPVQPSVVANCDKFYFVKEGDYCAGIAAANGISLSDFLAWNPAAGSSCSGLWKDAYACVRVTGYKPSTTTTTTRTTTRATTTTPSNGITTPTPIQSGMVKNCKTFYFVKDGQYCADVASINRISVSDFIKWNPAVGSNCASLWSNTWACVAVL